MSGRIWYYVMHWRYRVVRWMLNEGEEWLSNTLLWASSPYERLEFYRRLGSIWNTVYHPLFLSEHEEAGHLLVAQFALNALICDMIAATKRGLERERQEIESILDDRAEEDGGGSFADFAIDEKLDSLLGGGPLLIDDPDLEWED